MSESLGNNKQHLTASSLELADHACFGARTLIHPADHAGATSRTKHRPGSASGSPPVDFLDPHDPFLPERLEPISKLSTTHLTHLSTPPPRVIKPDLVTYIGTTCHLQPHLLTIIDSHTSSTVSIINMATATPETPAQYERDLRSANHEWKRSKDANVKWSYGSTASACWCTLPADTESENFRAQPLGKWSNR